MRVRGCYTSPMTAAVKLTPNEVAHLRRTVRGVWHPWTLGSVMLQLYKAFPWPPGSEQVPLPLVRSRQELLRELPGLLARGLPLLPPEHRDYALELVTTLHDEALWGEHPTVLAPSPTMRVFLSHGGEPPLLVGPKAVGALTLGAERVLRMCAASGIPASDCVLLLVYGSEHPLDRKLRALLEGSEGYCVVPYRAEGCGPVGERGWAAVGTREATLEALDTFVQDMGGKLPSRWQPWGVGTAEGAPFRDFRFVDYLRAQEFPVLALRRASLRPLVGYVDGYVPVHM